MDRRAFIGASAGGLLGTPLPTRAQEAGKVARIGIMFAGSADQFNGALRRGLAELGWVEGQNIHVEYRYAESQVERYPVLIAELLNLKVDVLVVGGGTAGARAAMRATSTIPIVLPIVGDPVAAGLVSSLARPGGNVTGLSMLNTEISSKRVELLRELRPRIEHVAVLRDPTVGGDWDATQTAALRLGLRLQLLDAGRPEEFRQAFETATKARAEALIVLASGMFNTQRRRLIELASQSRLIAVYEHRQFAEAGGLISYGPNLADMQRRAAKYIDKILRGAKPSDLPVEQPNVFELVINLKTAKALGLTIPQSVLLRADEVIQ